MSRGRRAVAARSGQGARTAAGPRAQRSPVGSGTAQTRTSAGAKVSNSFLALPHLPNHRPLRFRTFALLRALRRHLSGREPDVEGVRPGWASPPPDTSLDIKIPLRAGETRFQSVAYLTVMQFKTATHSKRPATDRRRLHAFRRLKALRSAQVLSAPRDGRPRSPPRIGRPARVLRTSARRRRPRPTRRSCRAAC